MTMNQVSILVLVAASVCLTQAQSGGITEFRQVCYFTNWSVYRPGDGAFTVSDVDPSLCTHINFAFAKIVGTTLQPYESSDSLLGGTWQQFNNLKLSAPGLKTLLSVGGYTHGPVPFTNMVATSQTRAAFASAAISLLRSYNFDGIDFDWEYPGQYNPSDKELFAIFLEEFRGAVEAEAASSGLPALIVSAAVSAGIDRAITSYDVPALNKYLDYINLMTYDYRGPWETQTGLSSPLKGLPGDNLTMESTIDWYLSNGASRDKLVIGLAAFGHSWSLANSNIAGIGAEAFSGLPGPYTKSNGVLAYYEVCSYLKQGMRVTFNPLAMTLHGVRGSQWVTYDNVFTFSIKLDYIISNGLGGAMMWALDEDDFSGKFCDEGPYPLLSIISRKLSNAPQRTTEQPSTASPLTTLKTSAPSTVTGTTSTEITQSTNIHITTRPSDTTHLPTTMTPSPIMNITTPPITTIGPTSQNITITSTPLIKVNTTTLPTTTELVTDFTTTKTPQPTSKSTSSPLITNQSTTIGTTLSPTTLEVTTRVATASTIGITNTPISTRSTATSSTLQTTQPSTTTQGQTLSTTTSAPKKVDCPKLFGHFAHGSDCNKFVVCIAGRPLLELRCHRNSNFNPSTQCCEFGYTC